MLVVRAECSSAYTMRFSCKIWGQEFKQYCIRLCSDAAAEAELVVRVECSNTDTMPSSARFGGSNARDGANQMFTLNVLRNVLHSLPKKEKREPICHSPSTAEKGEKGTNRHHSPFTAQTEEAECLRHPALNRTEHLPCSSAIIHCSNRRLSARAIQL
eukprot:1138134-Pelagomonas_calceolata.AAC.5